MPRLDGKGDSCYYCKHNRICKHFKDIQTMDLLPFTQSWVDEIQVLISRKFPEECRTYEKDYPDNRDSRGRLIGRKPLKIWYPNQNLEEKDKWECDFGRPYMRCKQR